MKLLPSIYVPILKHFTAKEIGEKQEKEHKRLLKLIKGF